MTLHHQSVCNLISMISMTVHAFQLHRSTQDHSVCPKLDTSGAVKHAQKPEYSTPGKTVYSVS